MNEGKKTLVVFLFIIKNVFASFCGENALPYSFEILPSGNSVLGCAKPNCLGWAHNRGVPSRFHNVNGQVDGFIREMKSINSFTNDTAECEDDFTSSKCIGDGEWVGGIKTQNDIGNDELLFRCCYHSDVKIAKFLTVYDIKANEKFEGGEVFNDDTGEQLYFDYINNIVKFVTDKGMINYEIFVNRLPCIPLQEKSNKKIIESNITIQSNSKKSKIDTTKLFQAPTFVADSQFLPVVEGGSSVPMQSANAPPPLVQNNAVPNFNNDLQAPQNPPQLQPPLQNNLQVAPLQNANNFQVAPLQSFQPMNNFAPFIPNSNPAPPVAPSVQYPYYYYYPVQTAPSIFRFLCFSGDTTVTTLNGKEKRLDELEINEWVLSSGGNVAVGYSKVNSWLHRMPKVEAEFIKFILEDGKELKITNKHFIYRGDCSQKNASVAINVALKDMVYAEDVKSTDCLFVKNGLELVETKISKIETVKEIGIYAPMTESGNIIVNDILASCYNIEKSSRIQSTLSTLVNENNYWWSLLNDLVFGNSFSADNENNNDENEIDLIPGIHSLISIVKHILHHKNFMY
uniref:Uncharacterized protein n=1 Tax=Panagrolaimus sp. ES5 TaxID=591445 RepID=A0AC34FM37_9BILA